MDLAAAAGFLTTHGRLLDRRRFALLLGTGTPAGVLGALAAHRNEDSGYGWGLEPDLRDRSSQPAAAMHALSVIAECGQAVPEAAALCDWLASVSVDGGALPFALPIADPSGCAPWWLDADPRVGSLQMTAQVAAAAQRVARFDRAVATHPWLASATAWCLEATRSIGPAPHAYELLFTLRFLDSLDDPEPALVTSACALVPPDGRLPVAGGVDGEHLRPTDLPALARAHLAPEVVSADLAELDAEQRPDGGWTVGFASQSPVAALEWRGHTTVEVVAMLLG